MITPDELFDPFKPLPIGAGRNNNVQPETRVKQRTRRAEISAVTRKILTENGVEKVTVRAIARESGYALQTIYNLVGPRDHAITEAISEYSLYVGRVASRKAAPSLANVVSMWITAAEAAPEFARQCHLIFFTPSRGIYYRFRDIQIRGMARFLRNQQAAGNMFFHLPPRILAQQLVYYASSMWVDWADNNYSLETLRENLIQGMVKLSRD